MKTKLVIIILSLLAALLLAFMFRAYLFKPKVAIQYCRPWRTVTGYTALCSELNALSNCTNAECQGNFTKTTRTSSALTNAMNSHLLFTSTQSIPANLQNDVMTAGNNWAYANAPPGYIISYIEYIPDIVTGPTAAGIIVKVTYKLCNGTYTPAK